MYGGRLKQVLPQLGYAYDALEPFIDTETMKLHHDKHHASYVDKLNAALKDESVLQSKPLDWLVRFGSVVPEQVREAVRNNAGGHWNHSMFWRTMRPNANADPVNLDPTGTIAAAINKSFGDAKTFRKRFTDAGLSQFGSGWVWLVANTAGVVKILTTPNQDSPLAHGFRAVLGNDLWEHAYYLKYKNRRADYLDAWWNVVDWNEVNARYLKFGEPL